MERMTYRPPPEDEAAIRDRERQRISRELHDGTTQLLVALQLQLARLRHDGQGANNELIDEMCDLIQEIQQSIREVQNGSPDGPARDKCFTDRQRAIAKVYFSLRNIDPLKS